MAVMAAENLIKGVGGELPKYIVNPEALKTGISAVIIKTEQMPVSMID